MNHFTAIAQKIQQATQSIQGDSVVLGDEYTSLPLSLNNFQSLPTQESNNKIVFIDGGNMEIASAPSFSVQLIRVHAAVYQNNKRIAAHTIENFALILAQSHESHIQYTTTLYPLKEHFILETTPTFTTHKLYAKHTSHPATPTDVVHAIRRFAEIELATSLAADLVENDCIVLDGVLKCTYTYEKQHLEKLYQAATQKNVAVSALAKTTRLLTKHAQSAAALLAQMKQGAWAYHPVAQSQTDEHKAHMYFVRLHEKSKYVFRFELHAKQHYETVLSLLTHNAIDPTFLGYPYGLIDADRFARVSEHEAGALRMRFLASVDDTTRTQLNTLNAHDILDSM